jgi:hypothetical protein
VRGVGAPPDHEEGGRHRHEPAHGDRDAAADEPLHDDLAGERPDGGARQAGREERDREERARRAAEQGHERLVRHVERLHVVQPVLEERARRHHEHRDVDQPRDRHRDHDVDLREAHQPSPLLGILGSDAILGQRRVEPDHVRHHGGAENPDGEEHRPLALEAGDDGVPSDGGEVWVRLEELDDVAGTDRQHHHADHRLERPEAEPLQPEDREGRDCGEAGRREEPDAGQELEADRRAEELREIGRDRDHLGLDPERDRDPGRELVAADLGEVSPRRDAELRRERLDQHRHQVRGDDHPHERVAVPRAAGDVRREVAWVDVGDRRDEGGPEEREETEPRCAAKHPFAAIDGCLVDAH